MSEVKPFIALGGAADLALARRAGIRPLGAVMGASAVACGTGWTPTFDGGELVSWHETFDMAVANGLERMIEAATNLGANLVANVQFRFLDRSEGELATEEVPISVFECLGTAYRYDELYAAKAPIVTNGTASDAVQIVKAGYHPVGLCVGAGFYYQSLGYRSANLRAARNAEHPDYTAAVRAVNALAIG